MDIKETKARVKIILILLLTGARGYTKTILEFESLDDVRKIVKEKMTKLNPLIGNWEMKTLPEDSVATYKDKGTCWSEIKYLPGEFYIEQVDKC